MDLALDTIIVDEAGCVQEMAVPMLLRLHPNNLILVGDHLQLGPFTHLASAPKNHCRQAYVNAMLHWLQNRLLPGGPPHRRKATP